MDAKLILKVAQQMIVKHRDDAMHYAEMRALELKSEPGAAANWRFVAQTIGMIYDLAPGFPDMAASPRPPSIPSSP